jgi:hypothetical protein
MKWGGMRIGQRYKNDKEYEKWRRIKIQKRFSLRI